MDSFRKKVEKAEYVGRCLVKNLIPKGELYAERLNDEFKQNKNIMFRINQHKVKDPEGYWGAIDPNLLAVCNNLVMGCLYSAMQVSNKSLSKDMDLKIQLFLEQKFFKVIDHAEAPTNGT